MILNVDSCYSKDYCLSQNIFAKVQTQSSTAIKSKLEESRLKDLKLANRKIFTLFYTNELGKSSPQDKKKVCFKKKQDLKNSILVIRDNIFEDKKKWNN